MIPRWYQRRNKKGKIILGYIRKLGGRNTLFFYMSKYVSNLGGKIVRYSSAKGGMPIKDSS